MGRALARIDGRFGRFLLVGGSNFLVGMLLFQAAWLAGASFGALRTPAAQAFAYTIGMAWSFFWNRHFVFRATDGPAARAGGEASRFVIAQILCLFISIVMVTATIDGLGLPSVLGWLAAMMPLVLLNFSLISRWVFPTGAPQPRAPAAPSATEVQRP